MIGRGRIPWANLLLGFRIRDEIRQRVETLL